MVITVTLNPAMDKTLMVDNFKVGAVNRANISRYDIGGKGINVSKVLKEFGVDSLCLGFLGGIWEQRFKDTLDKRNIKHDFISIKGDTRTNTKIVDINNNVFTDINEPGPEIATEELELFIEKFNHRCKVEDIVVLSGGAAPGIPKDIYKTLIDIAKKKGTLCILDADGELLKYGLEAKPHIIKPNEHELSKMLCQEITTKDQVIQAGKKLQSSGISKVLVSLGEKGSILTAPEGVYEAEGLKVKVKSTVGAGDSMVAALIYAHLKGFTPEDTLAFAQATATATVMMEGTEACSLNHVMEMVEMSKEKVKELK
ncbi:fructose-1-phosphate kinase [Clostridium amylolyticum]|uniref:Tagatose-6-phosphate kinase n=1 Tax=Clostridium amylolyticum TaxID=1121298 RepID=A0A1M6HLG5_9CLOT|nr:1-phosphofructokinase [Clostridium amylolyticum]SHJ22999.1 fructose-1-phosphate kinase [Clostridium amylolyticum]